MNKTKASCGCQVIAVGEPGSMARKACEDRHCGKPRCESGLPKKFSDRECAAHVWLHHRVIVGGWTVDMATKRVLGRRRYTQFKSLIEFAQHHGWEG